MSEAFFRMKYNEEDKILIIEVTRNVAVGIMKSIHEHLWPEIEHAKMEEVNITTEEGEEYKNVLRYAIPVYKDRIEIFFDGAMRVLAKSIKDSIPNSNN